MRAPAHEIYEIRRMKKLLDFFKKPPLWFLIIVAVIAVAAMVGGTLFMTQDSLSRYATIGFVLLGVMAVTVGYFIYGFVKIYPDLKSKALKWSEDKPFVNKALTDPTTRSIISLSVSFVINMAFAVYNSAIGIMNRSIWFGALSAYYIVLILLRGTILLYHIRRVKENKAGQPEQTAYLKSIKIYGCCGAVLILLPIALSFAIMQMVRAGDSFVHSGITIYVYAIYTFYKIIMAIYNFAKARSNIDLTVRAAQNITLAQAMMAVLALQTAMFHEFNAGDFVNVATMNIVTGAIVCGLTATIGVLMIVTAAKKSKQTKSNMTESV